MKQFMLSEDRTVTVKKEKGVRFIGRRKKGSTSLS